MADAGAEDDKDKVRLRRVLSVWDATACIVCTVIGAGIFVSPKAVLSFAGSPAAALGIWFAAGAVCSVIGSRGLNSKAKNGTKSTWKVRKKSLFIQVLLF